MNDRQSFGKRGRTPARPLAGAADKRQSIRRTVDAYEDPALTKIAVDRPWPAIAAAVITVAIMVPVMVAARDSGPLIVTFVPVMLIVGILMYFQFRGLRRNMQGDREREKRAIQARYPMVPVGGMIAGAVFFMVTKGQGPGDILAYDWSGIFGLRRDIATAEPLTATLFNHMATGGGAGLVLASLWYRLAKVHEDNNDDPTLGEIIKGMLR